MSISLQCDPDSRSISHARDIQLMKSTVTSSNGPHPLLVSEEYSFDRIVVSQVVGLDNETYDIMLIAAHSSGKDGCSLFCVWYIMYGSLHLAFVYPGSQ